MCQRQKERVTFLYKWHLLGHTSESKEFESSLATDAVLVCRRLHSKENLSVALNDKVIHASLLITFKLLRLKMPFPCSVLLSQRKPYLESSATSSMKPESHLGQTKSSNRERETMLNNMVKAWLQRPSWTQIIWHTAFGFNSRNVPCRPVRFPHISLQTAAVSRLDPTAQTGIDALVSRIRHSMVIRHAA